MKHFHYPTFFTAFALLATMACIQKKDPVFEVVLYQIKPEKVAEYGKIVKITNQFLQEQPGFRNRRVFQDKKENASFVDLVEWESLEAALSASKRAESNPDLRSFFEAIERVNSFSHHSEFL